METPAPVKKVTIVLSHSTDRSGSLSILERLRQNGVVNAFAFRTIAAVNARGELETNRMAELMPDLPVIIVWIDQADVVERILPQIRPLIREGVITVDDTSIDFVAVAGPRDLPESMTVADVMTRNVVTVEPATPVREVVADLLTRSFRALPVIDPDRKVVGIITNGDLVRRGGLTVRLDLLKTLDTPELHERLATMIAHHQEASEVMTRDVVTVPEGMNVRHAADVMIRRRLKRLPVVSDTGQLVGIVSRVDLLRSVMPAAGVVAGTEGLHGPFTGGTVLGDVMTHAVPAVSSDAPVTDVLNVIMATRLRRAIVVDEERTVLGIISDADLIERLDPDVRPGMFEALMLRVPFVHRGEAEDEAYRHAKAKTARDLMHTNIVVANEKDTVRDILGPLLESEQKAIPIVDDARRLVGIVDRADLLRAIVRL